MPEQAFDGAPNEEPFSIRGYATTPEERCELTLFLLQQAVEAFKEDARNHPYEMKENAGWIESITEILLQSTTSLVETTTTKEGRESYGT